MSRLGKSLEILPQSIDHVSEGTTILLANYFQRLVRGGGEFPSSLALTQDIAKYVSGGVVTPEQLAELLCVDPVLSFRLLSVANSSMFARNNPVESLLSVVQQLGYRRVSEAVQEAGEPKNYQAVFLGRAIAAGVFQQIVLGQEISRLIFLAISPRSQMKDRPPLWGILSRAPLLLLAFIRPQLFSILSLDQNQSGRNIIERNFKRAFGKSVVEFAVELSELLQLPVSLCKILSNMEVPPWNRRPSKADATAEQIPMAQSSYIGVRLAEEICRFAGKQAVDDLVLEYADKSNMKRDVIESAIGEASVRFIDRMRLLGFRSFRLPSYLADYQEEIVGSDGVPRKVLPQYPPLSERINPFLYELRACFRIKSDDEIGHVPQAVLCTMHALVKALQFDRAFFFRYNQLTESLDPICNFGNVPQNLVISSRSLSMSGEEHMPDIQAFRQRKCVFYGDPVFGDDWPFAAFPIVSDKGVEGVFYADRKGSEKAVALETSEQVAVVALAEGWQEVDSEFH